MRYLSRATPTLGALTQLAKSYSPDYEQHRLIWSLFSDHAERKRDFMWRWDPGVVWILSEREPQPSDLFTTVTKVYEPKLKRGDLLEFSMRVNPVVRVEVNGKKKKVDVAMHRKKQLGKEASEHTQMQIVHDACSGWIAKRPEFSTLQLDTNSYQQVRCGKGKGATRISFSRVDLSGALRVDEPDDFLANVVYSGLGSAKSFGCGLTLLRRV